MSSLPISGFTNDGNWEAASSVRRTVGVVAQEGHTVSHRFGFVLLLLALAAGACSSSSDEAGGTTSTNAVLSCDDVSPIIELLQSGLPTYDFEPAADLSALINSSDLVISGTLRSAQRVVDGESWTRVDTNEYQVLYTSDTDLSKEFADDPSFTLSSVWAQRDVDDPLAELVRFDSAQTEFVAFLRYTEVPAAPWSVMIQGLHVGCGGAATQGVIEALPPDTSGSAADIAAAVLAIVDQ